ncbi:MAG: hypothetical protein SFU99_08645, partial [Saprospiraceae bacterium]|nr:hypothetical protein [Saprospiraceae bacterium]
REQLVIPLAKALNSYDTTDQLSVQVDLSEKQLQIKIEDDPLALDLMLEELEKMTQANHASNLRRNITALQDGHFYNQFLSELDHLSMEKKHNKKFWGNLARANQYSDFLQIKEQFEELRKEIEEIELSLGLGSIGVVASQPQLYEKMEQWSEHLKAIKLRLISGVLPENSICFLAIFGTHLEQIVRFYMDLFQEKGFRYAAQSIWFREAFYNEQIEYSSYDEQGNLTSTIEPRKEYIKLECNPDEPNWQTSSEKPGDKLYGIEFTLFGSGVHLFFEDEGGTQRWKLSDQFDHLYVVQVEKHDLFIPEGIHRKEFYNAQPPRRIYEPALIRDVEFKINRELGRQSLSSFLREILQERFEANIDRMLY